MGVFERMRNGLIQFMYGRNGMDQLNRALLVVYLVVWILRMLTAASIHGPLYRVWDVLEGVLFILILVPHVLQKPLSPPGGEPGSG